MWACIKCVFSGRGKLDGMAVAKGQGPEIHLHCLNCVFTRCASKEGCPFVICLECQTPLHACKLDDHLAHICQNHMVPCCNEAYGCKVVLKRYKRASHLLHCPASIVQCRFAYQRLQHPHFGRKKSEDPRFSECVSVHEELLLNDLKFIANSDAAISEVAKKFETHFDKNLVDVDVSRVHSCLNQFRYLGDEFSKGKRSYELLAFSSYDYGTYRKIPSHSFTCGLFVQRKHFADHTKKHHDFCIDLHFITPRCPLNYYGCTFTSLEFEPASKGYLLEFKRDLNSFVVSSVSNCTPDAKGKDFLSSIPIEILVYLISFLDGFELWNLSQTSWYLRNICKNSLNEKGIVYFCWEKINGNWTTKSLVRTFPKTTPGVTQWTPVLHQQHKSVSCHLQDGCPAVESSLWASYSPELVLDLLKPLTVVNRKDMITSRCTSTPECLTQKTITHNKIYTMQTSI